MPDAPNEFINWITLNAMAGDVTPETGGLRAVRWSASGHGKSDGARVIYYNVVSDSTMWLLSAYAKANLDNPPVETFKELKIGISKKGS